MCRYHKNKNIQNIMMIILGYFTIFNIVYKHNSIDLFNCINKNYWLKTQSYINDIKIVVLVLKKNAIENILLFYADNLKIHKQI